MEYSEQRGERGCQRSDKRVIELRGKDVSWLSEQGLDYVWELVGSGKDLKVI